MISGAVGSGAFGTVYRARHATVGGDVAVKVLRMELGAAKSAVVRFFEEARSASAIRSEHVVKIVDFSYTERGQAFLVMEWLDGNCLGSLVGRGRLEPARALRIASQVAVAMTAAHAVGAVHRNLKPQNVFLQRLDRNPEFVKILDFGIASLGQALEATRTLQDATVATFHYLSPEQCVTGRPAGPASDVYALGVMVYEMLTGVAPFDGSGAGEIINKHLHQLPRSMRSHVAALESQLDAFVLRMLNKDADKRPSMSDLVLALGGPRGFEEETTGGFSEQPTGAREPQERAFVEREHVEAADVEAADVDATHFDPTPLGLGRRRRGTEAPAKDTPGRMSRVPTNRMIPSHQLVSAARRQTLYVGIAALAIGVGLGIVSTNPWRRTTEATSAPSARVRLESEPSGVRVFEVLADGVKASRGLTPADIERPSQGTRRIELDFGSGKLRSIDLTSDSPMRIVATFPAPPHMDGIGPDSKAGR